ncbi:MAG: hypothetical protein AVDCRST_MAG27-2188, partial [uncultured Craurococcus sp.]
GRLVDRRAGAVHGHPGRDHPILRANRPAAEPARTPGNYRSYDAGQRSRL